MVFSYRKDFVGLNDFKESMKNSQIKTKSLAIAMAADLIQISVIGIETIVEPESIWFENLGSMFSDLTFILEIFWNLESVIRLSSTRDCNLSLKMHFQSNLF